MKLKDVLAKVAKGEALSAEEKQFLAEHDPDKAVNDAAAAARRKAEEKATELEAARAEMQRQLDELKAKLAEKDGAGRTDLQKAQAQIDALSKQITDLSTKLEGANKAQTQMARNSRLAEIRQKNGIQFVPELDHNMLAQSFNAAFEGIEDLNNEDVVKTKVTTWRAMNRAGIVDASGHGTGSPPHAGGMPSSAAPMVVNGKDLIQMAQSGSLEDAEKLLNQATQADVAGKLEIR